MKLSTLIEHSLAGDPLIRGRAVRLTSPRAHADRHANSNILALNDDSRALNANTIFVATEQARPYLAGVLRAASKRQPAAILLPESLMSRGADLYAPNAQGSAAANLQELIAEQANAGEAHGPRLIFTDDLFSAQGRMASALHDHPSDDLHLVGVTGTNGKTSVTRMLDAIWQGLGIPSATIGTLGVEWRDAAGQSHSLRTGYTTPRAPQLQALLARLRDDGVRGVALEVSSEALALGRLAGTRFSQAAFTNLSVDHLDYHGTLENYYLAKRELFEMTARQGGRFVIALADETGQRLVREFQPGGECADFMRPVGDADPDERMEAVVAPEITDLPAPTVFNQWNASLAARLAANSLRALNQSAAPARIAALLREHPPIPGRFVRIVPRDSIGDNRLQGVVDYAHTPDALENVLREARALDCHWLVCVVGCGGDRDASKRSAMGAIAARLADCVIVCDDNPRTEDPASIRSEIVRGAQAALGEMVAGSESSASSPSSLTVLESIGDRRAAIRRAVALAVEALAQRPIPAGRQAIVLVAGKGHEELQIFADRRAPFSDTDELRAAFADYGEHSKHIEHMPGQDDLEAANDE